MERDRRKRAKERIQANARRTKRVWVDAQGLTWEGRVREHKNSAELFPVVTLTVTGPMELDMLDRHRAVVRMDTRKVVEVSPMMAMPLPWTQPQGERVPDGIVVEPAIGVVHAQMFQAVNVIAGMVAAEEPASYMVRAS